jgi:hypothetical protein
LIVDSLHTPWRQSIQLSIIYQPPSVHRDEIGDKPNENAAVEKSAVLCMSADLGVGDVFYQRYGWQGTRYNWVRHHLFVGAIVAFICVLINHIVKITQSKIAKFFAYLLPWTFGTIFGRVYIFGDKINATSLGIIFFMGTIYAFLVVLIIQVSKMWDRG